MEAGIDGIILEVLSAKANTLTRDEKISLLRFTKQAISRPVPVIMNIAEQSTIEAIQFAKDAEKKRSGRTHAPARCGIRQMIVRPLSISEGSLKAFHCR